MAVPDLPDRVALLERLQEQQAQLNDQLIEITARLGEEHALYQERLNRHEAQMAQLRDILQAIKDMLDRGNGH
jgi:predicted nuclease with TOPRIM domain